MVSNFLVEKASMCKFRSCQKPAEGMISHQTFCREHVLLICRERIDAAAALIKNKSVMPGNTSVAREFIVECARAAKELMRDGNDLAPAEQAAVMEILIRVEDLSQRLLEIQQ